jgi:hypothetical protein
VFGICLDFRKAFMREARCVLQIGLGDSWWVFTPCVLLNGVDYEYRFYFQFVVTSFGGCTIVNRVCLVHGSVRNRWSLLAGFCATC